MLQNQELANKFEGIDWSKQLEQAEKPNQEQSNINQPPITPDGLFSYQRSVFDRVPTEFQLKKRFGLNFENCQGQKLSNEDQVAILKDDKLIGIADHRKVYSEWIERGMRRRNKRDLPEIFGDWVEPKKPTKVDTILLSDKDFFLHQFQGLNRYVRPNKKDHIRSFFQQNTFTEFNKYLEQFGQKQEELNFLEQSTLIDCLDQFTQKNGDQNLDDFYNKEIPRIKDFIRDKPENLKLLTFSLFYNDINYNDLIDLQDKITPEHSKKISEYQKILQDTNYMSLQFDAHKLVRGKGIMSSIAFKLGLDPYADERISSKIGQKSKDKIHNYVHDAIKNLIKTKNQISPPGGLGGESNIDTADVELKTWGFIFTELYEEFKDRVNHKELLEMFSDLDFVASPTGEDLSGSDKRGILEIAKEAWLNDHADIAQAVIKELEDKLCNRNKDKNENVENQIVFLTKLKDKVASCIMCQNVDQNTVKVSSFVVAKTVQGISIARVVSDKVRELISQTKNIVAEIAFDGKMLKRDINHHGFVIQDNFNYKGHLHFTVKLDTQKNKNFIFKNKKYKNEADLAKAMESAYSKQKHKTIDDLIKEGSPIIILKTNNEDILKQGIQELIPTTALNEQDEVITIKEGAGYQGPAIIRDGDTFIIAFEKAK